MEPNVSIVAPEKGISLLVALVVVVSFSFSSQISTILCYGVIQVIDKSRVSNQYRSCYIYWIYILPLGQ